MESIKQFFSNSPSHKKIIVSTLAVTFLGYTVYKLLTNQRGKDCLKSSHKTEKDLISNLKREL